MQSKKNLMVLYTQDNAFDFVAIDFTSYKYI